MKTQAPLILASQSPRRQQLLRELEFEFEVVVRPTDEYFPEDIHPRAVAVLISENKAKQYDPVNAERQTCATRQLVCHEACVPTCFEARLRCQPFRRHTPHDS